MLRAVTTRAAPGFLLSLLAGLLLLSSCARPASEDSDSSPAPSVKSSAALRPGDRLLDRLDEVRVGRFPTTNLPPDLAEFRASGNDTVVARSDPVPMDAWDYQTGEMIEVRWPGVRVPSSDHAIFYCPFPLPPGSPPPVIVRNGRRQEPWDPASGLRDDPVFWYDTGGQTVYAIADDLPEGVALEYPRSFDEILDGLELDGAAPAPRANDLRRRVVLGNVARDVLFLPAPGAVEIELTGFDVDGLDVSVGVVDRAWEMQEGVLVPTSDLSDGVTFRIEVEPLGEEVEAQVPWARHVLPSEGFVDGRVGLSPFRGRDIRLRLISDPGPGGNVHFDYAVWGGLRFPATPAGKPERPHVVIVDIDTLRADRTGLHGYSLPTTPSLDRWAAEHATVYLDAIAPSNWTRPSTTSILTGLTVNQHHVGGDRPASVAAFRPLALVLSEAGYETRAVVGGGHLMPDFGLDIGFEVYDYANDEPDWNALTHWLAHRDSRHPAFLFLQTYMVHAPYQADGRFLPHPDFGGRFAGKPFGHELFPAFQRNELELTDEEKRYVSLLYDAGVRRMDDRLGPFLEAVDTVFAGEDALVIITSDHGESLFEHGVLGHGQVLYSQLLSVPLVVRFPGGEPRRLAVPVSGLDIVPTVLDLAGLPIPNRLPGLSLLRPAGADRIRVAETAGGHYALLSGRYKLIKQGGTLELYDLSADPRERSDLSADEPERARSLETLLGDYLERYSRVEAEAVDTSPSAETLRSLKALGYVN
jgi:arylsulfatase A-like enzyme